MVPRTRLRCRSLNDAEMGWEEAEVAVVEAAGRLL